MTTFDDREQAFERKYVLDEEQRFRATARRNKLLGAWAAEKLGKSDDEAAEYAKSVVHADFAEAGDDDVFRKLRADLDASVTDEAIRAAMQDFLLQAAAEIKGAS